MEIFPVSDGRFRLDGGAMFGVVPKVLWEKCCPADEKNRIALSLTCLLIRTAGKHILVDTGLGEKADRKFQEMFKVESEGQIALFLGDVIPTVSHLPLPYIMGYDLYPLQTLETKRWLLQRAHEEGWLLVFEHDPQIQMGYVHKDIEGKYYLMPQT